MCVEVLAQGMLRRVGGAGGGVMVRAPDAAMIPYPNTKHPPDLSHQIKQLLCELSLVLDLNIQQRF